MPVVSGQTLDFVAEGCWLVGQSNLVSLVLNF